MSDKIYAIILSAGLGKRMNSDLPKVLHRIDNKSLVEHVILNVLPLNPAQIIVVVGYKGEMVKKEIAHYPVDITIQEKQLGTADALKSAIPHLKGDDGLIFVLCGDAPFVDTETLLKMKDEHIKSNSRLTILTAVIDDPTGYGRIVRNNNGDVISIVEERDASPEIKKIKEFNSGTYIFDLKGVLEAINIIDSKNAQKEFYLTDIVKIFLKRNWKVGTFIVDDPFKVSGINSQEELKILENEYLRRLNKINDKT